ncbi:MAG: response regulator [Bacteroidota bacterium]|nr:response regulator [Bacteroidota bacterium]
MKKIYLIITTLIVILLLANVYYYFNIYEHQVSYQKNILLKQAQISSSEIERTGYLFESDLNYIIFSENFLNFFSIQKQQSTIVKKLQIFYSKYEELVSNITYFDIKKNEYNLFRDRKNKFFSDIYTAHNQRNITRIDQINLVNGEYLFSIPVFENNTVVGNLVVTIDYIGAISSIFQKSHLEGIQWQWLIDTEGSILYNNYGNRDELNISAVNNIANEINEDVSDAIQHIATINGEEHEIISAFYSTRFLRRDFGVIFSSKSELILRSIISNSIAIASITTLLIILIILLFYLHLKKNRETLKIVKQSEDGLFKIIDTIPIGIIIYDQDKTIKRINRFAQELFEHEEGVQVGNKLGNWYTSILKNASMPGSENGLLDEVVSYKKEDKEHFLLIEKTPFRLQEEKLLLDAIIEVTAFEKARKQEAMAVKTKSDFLANMSREICTPLNSIIGMADSIDKKNLKIEQKDFISSIKKSAELLHSIVDDILTYSKIEAGEIFLDEIPFKFRVEMDHAIKLLVTKAKEKNLELLLKIDDNVPEEIIGDPFKIRQIISSLGDNAVTFTQKGQVSIKVEQIENISGKLKLKFVLEDTGTGIAPEDIDSVFQAPTQSDNAMSEKPEGANIGPILSKQLIELLKGEIDVESPSGLSEEPDCPGTKFTFVLEVFADQRQKKNISTDKITSYSHINALVIKDNNNYGQKIMEMLKNFGLSARLNFYQEKTINLIQSNLQSEKDRYHILIIRDSSSFNGFKFAETLYDRDLTDKFLIIMASSNDRKGNYVKSRKLGLDYYIIEPCNGSEFFNILQENFPNIRMTPKDTGQLTRLKKGLKILVAEDNIINQKVAQTFFKNLGYEIDIAENGKLALKKVSQKEYDIVFMDIMMPEMDGWEATQLLREEGKDFPIVAITADIGEEAREKAKEEGMNDFIPKPVRIEEIKRVLLRWFSESAT